jgi:hypothetical protein
MENDEKAGGVENLLYHHLHLHYAMQYLISRVSASVSCRFELDKVG